jgi:hypothetical protein
MPHSLFTILPSLSDSPKLCDGIMPPFASNILDPRLSSAKLDFVFVIQAIVMTGYLSAIPQLSHHSLLNTPQKRQARGIYKG